MNRMNMHLLERLNELDAYGRSLYVAAHCWGVLAQMYEKERNEKALAEAHKHWRNSQRRLAVWLMTEELSKPLFDYPFRSCERINIMTEEMIERWAGSYLTDDF